MNTGKYQGCSNRSTWLVCVYLDNTNLKVYESAKKIGRYYKEMIDDYRSWLKRHPLSYSWPVHQEKSIKQSIFDLLDNETKINTEADYKRSDINIHEVCKHFIVD